MLQIFTENIQFFLYVKISLETLSKITRETNTNNLLPISEGQVVYNLKIKNKYFRNFCKSDFKCCTLAYKFPL